MVRKFKPYQIEKYDSCVFLTGNTDSDFSAFAQDEIYKRQYYNDFISRMYDSMQGNMAYGKINSIILTKIGIFVLSSSILTFSICY